MAVSRKKAFIPFVIFVTIAGFLAVGLTLNPREVPSPFIGKPAPEFNLPALHVYKTGESIQFDGRLSNAEFTNQVWILNVWASWCVACLQEHPLLNELSQTQTYPLVGLNYKDDPIEAINWLNKHGNPYSHIGADIDGQTGINFGVYGVPETFVIDKFGKIRLKHIGPLTEPDITDTLLPLLDQLDAESVSND